MAKTLQQQGVPIRSGLATRSQRQTAAPRARRQTVRDRTPLDGRMGGTRDTTTYYEYDSPKGPRKVGSPGRSMRRYNPANAGESAGGGVGGLEAEFLLAILLLVLLMFANNNASYSDRIMSFMKRGSLTCLLFFVLALIASTGQSASRIAKAIGALIIVAILITSPVNTVLSDVDNLIKNDWVGTTESAGDQTSASSGTQQSTNTSNLGSDFVKALENELNLQGQKATSGNPLSKSNIATDIKNALTGTLNGIIPGAGSILSKLGL